MQEKALVAMSGGVDSSVAAYLIREAGYETTGVTMRLYDNEMIGVSSEKTCCSLASIEDALDVANRLGIFYIVYDFREEFREEVIERFVRAYENGETPNPCIECNRYLKFDKLYECGREIDQDYIVTGHYAIIETDGGTGRKLLRKSVDLSKDQSYVLYPLTQDQLKRTLFPLGHLHKTETRRIAEEQGFLNAQKGDSQDICFVPDGKYTEFIERYTNKIYPSGPFMDRDGNVLGEHRGIIRYTIGQRKGLGLALKKPMYVSALDIPGNRVILGDNEDLFTREFEAEDMNWIAMDPPSGDFRASARIRYKHREAPATVIPIGEGRVRVLFDEPQRAITPGQSVVLYEDDYVIGGGRICRKQ